jgi:hypothetical protein
MGKDWPQRRDTRSITAYMKQRDRVPVMTQADSVVDKGNNGYAQPTAALLALRDVVMGRELFDHAFRTYAQRWMFKRPAPADFFRTMEDASGIDLDWFWRGWLPTQSITSISRSRMSAGCNSTHAIRPSKSPRPKPKRTRSP